MKSVTLIILVIKGMRPSMAQKTQKSKAPCNVWIRGSLALLARPGKTSRGMRRIADRNTQPQPEGLHAFGLKTISPRKTAVRQQQRANEHFGWERLSWTN